jgi:enoyl-CoA hydratase/carnithine racemase
MSEHIEVVRMGAVQTIRMNRPEKKNALTRAMYARMTEALRAGDADAGIRVQVFLGLPEAFTAGNDLADFLVYAQGGGLGTEVVGFLMAIARAEKPLLAAVDGIAVGIGATMQFHCDLTIASPRALFRTPFTHLGLTPEAASSLLAPAAIGPQAAFALLALGEDFPAERALAAGLVQAIVPVAEIEAAVLKKAGEIASRPPEALRIARDLIRGDRAAVIERIETENRIFSERLRSPEAIAAVTAFMNRKSARQG